MSYYLLKNVDTNFEETLEKVTEKLQEEGFGVLTEIDVKATLKKKLDVDFRNYKILGACNPPFAHKALSAEDHIGILLPCNVVVQETTEGKVVVSIVNPLVAMESVHNENLVPLATEVKERLDKVLEKL